MITRNPEANKLDRFRTKRRRWWRLVLLVVLALFGWYGSTLFLALNRVTTPNITSGSSILKSATKGEEQKPINVLLLGIGGAEHGGSGNLADSIMVLSLDVKDNTVSLLSLPRDFYVPAPGGGHEKINAIHSLGELDKKQKGGGPTLMKQVVSDTLGIPIHYFIRVDFEGFKKIVDALGGVTVDVKTALYDPYFPDAKLQGYEPFSVKAGVQKFDGKTALKYARSRQTTSDFDRARRQQEIILAIRDKALTAETLANPKKVTDIITIVGKHMLTDFSASEIDDLIRIAKSFDNPTINRQVLSNAEGGLLVSSRSSGGAFILIPRTGMDNFAELQLFAQSYFVAPTIKKEQASVRLERTSAVTKDTLTKVSKQFEAAGFVVTLGDEAVIDETKTSYTDTSKGKKLESLNFIKSTLNITEKKSTTSPVPAETAATDYVVVVGADFPTLKTVSSAKIKSSPKATPISSLTSTKSTVASGSSGGSQPTKTSSTRP